MKAQKFDFPVSRKQIKVLISNLCVWREEKVERERERERRVFMKVSIGIIMNAWLLMAV